MFGPQQLQRSPAAAAPAASPKSVGRDGGYASGGSDYGEGKNENDCFWFIAPAYEWETDERSENSEIVTCQN